jgi:hypothetical protein
MRSPIIRVGGSLIGVSMSISDRPELESDASELVPVASISVNFFIDANEGAQLNGLKKGSLMLKVTWSYLRPRF